MSCASEGARAVEKVLINSVFCFQMRSTGLREKTLRRLTLRNSSPYYSDRTLWRGWAQVQTRKEQRNCSAAHNMVRGRQKQHAAINSPVAVSATSALLIIPSHQGRN